MLKVNLDYSKGVGVVTACGDLVTVLCDVATVINSVYTEMLRGPAPETAKICRSCLIDSVNMKGSPVWAPDNQAFGISCIDPRGMGDGNG